MCSNFIVSQACSSLKPRLTQFMVDRSLNKAIVIGEAVIQILSRVKYFRQNGEKGGD